MNEREFDDIFKDRIGDELPFDFRPGDWETAMQELDKVMPVVSAPTATPNPMLKSVGKVFGISKWAAAAAVVVMASQGWLLAKLFDVSHELKTLKEQNNIAIVPQQPNVNAPSKAVETIIVHDTIVKTVYIEVPTSKKNELNKLRSPELISSPNSGTWTANNSPASQNGSPSLDKAVKNNNNLINNKLAPNELNTPNNIAIQNNNDAIKNLETKANNTPNSTETTHNSVIAQNNNSTIDKTLTPNNSNNTPISAETNSVNGIEKNNNTATIAHINHLPTIKLGSVHSLYKNALWMNSEDLDMLYSSRKSIIKTLPVLTDWKIGVNAFAVVTELPKDVKKVNYGYNGRVMYDLNRNWRASADISFWQTSFSSHIDSIRKKPDLPVLPSDYTLSQEADFSIKTVQARLGGDYLISLKSSNITPFLGFGITYQWQTKNDIQYQFKSKNPSRPNIPIPIHNDEDEDSPYFLSLRAGVEGKIYRRLGWSVNITNQLRLDGNKNNQVWSGQLGLVYNL